MKLRDGIPCKHPGCLSHISHPCEGCGRVGGRSADFINGEGSESDITLDGIFAHSPTEEHTWPTYGGITRNTSPEMNYTKTEGGCITPEMIAAVYSPEALRRELESEFETNRQKAEMMKPYIGAPFMVHAAAWRVTLSNFGAPLHPNEAKRLTAILDEWMAGQEATNAGPELSETPKNLTMADLKAAMDKLPTFPKLPPYYRCHPSTYQNLLKYMPKSEKDPPIWFKFNGVRIEEDVDVPPGEFWPPEEGKAHD